MVSAHIPIGAKVLVTGVNGYIASHVADQLLEDGYNVRGSVRSNSRGNILRKYFEKKYGNDRFELVVVKDICKMAAFDEACKDVSGIVHLASAAIFTADPNETIPPTVAGALSVFRAAQKESSIKSIVYTSDSFAALLPQPNKVVEISSISYSEDALAAAFNPLSAQSARDTAWDPSIAGEIDSYAAAKVAAEKAVWRFVEEHEPSFQVSTILPNVNIGGSVGGLPLSSTGTFVPKLLAGDASGLFFPAQHYINVRDCARLHVAALLDPDQRNQRIFAVASPFNWNDVLAILRKLRPNVQIIEDLPNLGRDLSVLPKAQAEQLLRKRYGHAWTNLEESVRQNIENL